METAFTADIALLSMIAGTFLPILVGIVTKKLAAGGLKSIVLAALSGATGVINGAINADGAFSSESLQAAFLAWVVAVASYYGFWKPTGGAEKVQDATANAGIG